MAKCIVIISACVLFTLAAACTFEQGSPHSGGQAAVAPTSQVATTEATNRNTILLFVERLQDRKRGDDEADITAMAESPDGKHLAWGDDKGSVRVHSFADKKTSTLLDLSGSDITARRTVRDLAFDAEGQLWWVDVSRNVYRYDLSQGKGTEIKKVAVAVETNVVSSNLLPGGVLSTDAKLAWPPKDYLRLLEVGSGKVHDSDVIFPEQRGANALVQHGVRSSDGRLLMAVADGNSALLSLPDMKILRRFGQGWGKSAAFSPSSELAALGTDGRGVFVWKTETGKLVKQIPLRRSAVIDSLVFVSETVLYAADYPLHRIDVKTGTVDSVAEVNACLLLLSRSGERLFVGIHEGGLNVYALPAMDVQPKQPETLPTSRTAK